MQFPITIGLRRSLFLTAAVALVHVLALAVQLLPTWPGAKALAVVGVTISAAWFIFFRRKVDALRLHFDGRIECHRAGETYFVSGSLLPPATVHPDLIVMRVACAGTVENIVVAPDTTTAEARRVLRVWLRWRASLATTAVAP